MLKTGINLNPFGFDCDTADLAKAVRSVGFDTFFTGFADDDAKTEALAEIGARTGLVYESIHAPFGGLNCIWDEGEAGDEFVRRIRRVADTCKKFGIGYFTLHCMNVPKLNVDINDFQRWSELGLSRFRSILEYASDCSVKACFENVEFPQFELKRLLETFRTEGYDSLGFTWDVGHEHCYPGGIDVADAFGDLLVGTHVHDNFGQADPHVITWLDDDHLLPFDGTVDFRRVGQKLKKCNYQGTVTLEARRNEMIPWYRSMTLEQFLQTAHERAERIAMWCEEPFK